ncbi:hypothetical protein PIB30_097911 [Stylosanthes scabra]|uniref:Uncharacterized protein n=1 Tax=Stylosanthes scabra TaxID=79078 RepID=A0ABU6VWI9_9FABA|nr:hypothetical protein [Stylosanthes scabra]
MEVPETQVEIDPWENEMQPIIQGQMQHGVAECGHATDSGVNNKYSIINHSVRSMVSQGETHLANQPSSSMCEGGEQKQGHGEGTSQQLQPAHQQSQGESYTQQVQKQVLASPNMVHPNASFQQQPHGQDAFMQIDNKLTQREDSADLPFSVNQESNLQGMNNNIRLKMKADLNTAGNQEQISTQQKQTIYDSPEQPMPIKELLNMAFRNSDTTNYVSNSADIWNFRDKPKLMSTFDEKGRKIIQRRIAEAPYIVELADEDEVIKENESLQPLKGAWEMELAQNISSCLQIKRKRAEASQL